MTQRIAVVTGGAGAIGEEICKALAAQGCKVAVIEHPAAAARAQGEWKARMAAEGYDITVAVADLGDYESTGAAIKAIESACGPVGILVNAAGITRDAAIRKMTPQQWREVISANLDSVFNTTSYVFGGMLERSFGRIINISSINGTKGQFGQANYAATKAGIHGFTMSIALEGAKKGVTANTVSPGYIATPMVMAVPEDIRAKIVAQIPVGRMGEAREIARLVAFLAHDDSGFMTGANFAINGGQHMH
ncbi:Acetoacetyl-CoA reductase [Gammaproteobacteria bacterium]